MAEQRLFQVAGIYLSREQLFWFLDRYHHCAGLPPADSYDMASLNYGLKVFMPAWYFLAQRRYAENYDGMFLPGVSPSFEDIAGMHPASERPTPDLVEQLLKPVVGIPPTGATTRSFSLRSVAQSLDYLLTTGETSVARLYRPRTCLSKSASGGYSKEDLHHNLTTVLANAVHEYKVFANANSLNRLQSRYLDENVAYLYAGDLSNLDGQAEAPVLEIYRVENYDRKLTKVSFVDKSSTQVPFIVDCEKLSISGIERKVLEEQRILATDLFRDFRC